MTDPRHLPVCPSHHHHGKGCCCPPPLPDAACGHRVCTGFHLGCRYAQTINLRGPAPQEPAGRRPGIPEPVTA